jgi:hypothetical protein
MAKHQQTSDLDLLHGTLYRCPDCAQLCILAPLPPHLNAKRQYLEDLYNMSRGTSNPPNATAIATENPNYLALFASLANLAAATGRRYQCPRNIAHFSRSA